MKSLNLFAAVTALALAGGAGAAHADAERVLEEVVVTAKAPAGPRIELVLVVAELPESLEAERAAPETAEVVVGLDRPRVDANAAFQIARPTLRL